MALTAVAVEKMKAGSTRREIPDGRISGLFLIIQPGEHAAKTWAVRSRLHGKSLKITLGRWPTLGLAAARAEASSVLLALDRGEDPREAAREKAEAARRAASDTFEAVLEEWFKRDQSGNRSVLQVRQAMERNVLPFLKGWPLATITRRDVIEVLDRIADRGAVTLARRVHAYLARLFRWAVGRGIIADSPMRDLPKPGAENPRDRVLDDAELARVWRAAGTLGYPFGDAVRLLLLTGARKTEIGELRRQEVGEDSIELAGARTKNSQPHTIPLSPEARSILAGLPRIANRETGRPELCFSTNGRTAVSGWSKAKLRIDELAAGIGTDGQALDEPSPLTPWRLHDLRRTVATGLQRLGHRLEVIEAILGHVGGSRAGIVGIYQRHSFGPEARLALESWARHIGGLLEPGTGQVLVLRR